MGSLPKISGSGKAARMNKPTLNEMREWGLPYPDFLDGLRALQERSGVSQNDFAVKIGCSQPYLSRLYKGLQFAPLEKILGFCQHLGMSFGQVVAASQPQKAGKLVALPAVKDRQVQEFFPDQIYLPYLHPDDEKGFVLTGQSPFYVSRDWAIDRGARGDLAVYREDFTAPGFSEPGDYVLIDMGTPSGRYVDGAWYLLFFNGGAFFSLGKYESGLDEFVCSEEVRVPKENIGMPYSLLIGRALAVIHPQT